MPGNLFQADSNYPNLDRYDTTEAKLAAIQDYLFMLLEQLRYALRNIGPENINTTEMITWINEQGIEPAEEVIQEIITNKIITNTFITNELYSNYGAIADLVVDELRTDYRRAQKYLAGDTSAIDYLHIYDEEIDFITATYAGGTEQLHHGARYFWWTDSTHTQMTSTEQTDYPVIVYTYSELVKGTYRFDSVTQSGVTVKVPELVFGAGYGDQSHPNRGKGFIRKNTNSFDMWLLANDGKELGVFIGDNYTDIAGLRRTTSLDLSNLENGTVTETVEGDPTVYSYGVAVTASDITVTYPDGQELVVTL